MNEISMSELNLSELENMGIKVLSVTRRIRTTNDLLIDQIATKNNSNIIELSISNGYGTAFVSILIIDGVKLYYVFPFNKFYTDLYEFLLVWCQESLKNMQDNYDRYNKVSGIVQTLVNKNS